MTLTARFNYTPPPNWDPKAGGPNNTAGNYNPDAAEAGSAAGLAASQASRIVRLQGLENESLVAALRDNDLRGTYTGSSEQVGSFTSHHLDKNQDDIVKNAIAVAIRKHSPQVPEGIARAAGDILLTLKPAELKELFVPMVVQAGAHKPIKVPQVLVDNAVKAATPDMLKKAGGEKLFRQLVDRFMQEAARTTFAEAKGKMAVAAAKLQAALAE